MDKQKAFYVGFTFLYFQQSLNEPDSVKILNSIFLVKIRIAWLVEFLLKTFDSPITEVKKKICSL